MNGKPQTKEDIGKLLKNKYPNFKEIEKIDDANFGEKFILKVTVKSDAIKLSPPIRFLPSNKDKSKEATFSNEIFGIPFEIKERLLYKNTKGPKSLSNHVDEYNLIISEFNILGLPFDYISSADIMIFAEDKEKKSLEFSISDKAKRRGKDIPVIEISEEEKGSINYIFNEIFGKLKTIKIDGLEDIFKFFGYANYNLFHGDIFLAFINSWMFIEPYINSLWTEMMKEAFKDMKDPPIEDKRNWTLQQKIDELYMMNKISSDTRAKLQDIRSKRNKVFHVDDNPHKRKVELQDAISCYQLARRLFYKMLGQKEGMIIGNYKINDIRKRMGTAIFGKMFLHHSMPV